MDLKCLRHQSRLFQIRFILFHYNFLLLHSFTFYVSLFDFQFHKEAFCKYCKHYEISSNDKYSQGTNGENLFFYKKRDVGMLKRKEIGIVEVQAMWDKQQ